MTISHQNAAGYTIHTVRHQSRKTVKTH